MSQPMPAIQNNNANNNNNQVNNNINHAPVAANPATQDTNTISAAALEKPEDTALRTDVDSDAKQLQNASETLMGKLANESLAKMRVYTARATDGVEAHRTVMNPVYQGSQPTSGNPLSTEGKGKSSVAEPNTGCQTCAERTYQDGSDDSGVSFQTASHISSGTAGIKVASHEREHVTRETAKAQEEGRIVTQAKVTMQMACCPECHRVYTAGGMTTIQTQPANEQANVSSALDNMSGEFVDVTL